ncbi:MAG: phosphopantetheine-binding protein [Tetragenococcus halophilus]|nr:phosphopantetheine-binding protein [Lactococcus lactis]MDN5480534.1 phosphopantetheine-binding protein [Chryseobacterium sp.]MDN6203943.1 phosphopantetheine-binding protein [Tetragenococcus halophilus]MDN6032385.1 phosphopantetheine-binding protein [Lactococcus lactis]MDN6034692.1 phosphopantetheine-binding protein [Lactococcus lactis]
MVDEQVKEVIASAIETDEGVKRAIGDNDSLTDDLDFDSVRMMILITLLEEKFDLDIDEGEISGIKTVSEVTTFIEKKLEENEK